MNQHQFSQIYSVDLQQVKDLPGLKKQLHFYFISFTRHGKKIIQAVKFVLSSLSPLTGRSPSIVMLNIPP